MSDMDEYIKRDEAEKALEEHRRSQKMSMFVNRDLLEEYCHGVVGAMNVLYFVPTADVVPRAEVEKIFEEINLIFRKYYEESSEKPDLKLLEPIRQAERFIINEMWYEFGELKKKYIGDKQRKEYEGGNEKSNRNIAFIGKGD